MNTYIKNSITNLKNFANSHGFKVKFRNYTTNAGDFCIFIYKNGQSRYLVGFDGYWDVDKKNSLSFDSCWEASINYIKNKSK